MKIKQKIDSFILAVFFYLALFSLSERSYSALEDHFPLLKMVISSPVFRRGDIKFTSNDEVYSFLQNLSKKSPHVKYNEMDLSSGNSIPYVIISENGNYNSGKPTVWIEAMQHGDEPGSGEAALGLAEFFSLNAGGYLANMNIIILPRLNMYNQNSLRGGIDMNTDHVLLSSPEAKALKREILRYSPEVVLDLHEYPASEEAFSRLPTRKILPYYDILVSPPTNRNISAVTKAKQKSYITNVQGTLEKKDIRLGYYYNGVRETNGNLTLLVPSASIKIARNSFALIPTLSFLIEGRGKDLGLKLFQRRVGSLEDAVVSFLNNFKGQSREIKSYLAGERSSIISRGDSSILLTTGRENYQDTFKFINLATNRVEMFPVTMSADFTRSGGLFRKAPSAYLIEPNNDRVLSKLDEHGIRYDILNTEKTFNVERYRKGGDGYTLENVQQSFPQNTAVVDLGQIQKLMIVLLFEPESETSLVNLGLTSSKNGFLPYSRILN